MARESGIGRWHGRFLPHPGPRSGRWAERRKEQTGVRGRPALNGLSVSVLLPTPSGVNPSAETIRDSDTRRSMVFPSPNSLFSSSMVLGW